MTVRYLSLLALLLLASACMELPEGPEAWDTVYYVPEENADKDGDNWDGPKISEAMISDAGVVTLYWQRLHAADDVARVIVDGSDANSSYRPVFEAEGYVRKAEMKPEQFGVGQRYRVRVEMKDGTTLLGRPRALFPRYVRSAYVYTRPDHLVFSWTGYDAPADYELRLYARGPSADDFDLVATVDPPSSPYEYYPETEEEGDWTLRYELYFVGDGWEALTYVEEREVNWTFAD